MKLKYLLFPYVLIIVILPGLVAHLSVPLGLNVPLCEKVLDILMAGTAVIGLGVVVIRKKRSFSGWILLILLTVLVLIPQVVLWRMQGGKRLINLRPVYRFALIYITLFVIPTGIRLSNKETCVLIGLLCLYGVACCAYQVMKTPNILTASPNSIRSFFENPNRFGAYLALWFIICIFAVQLSGSLLWLIPGAIFAFFLVLGRSRASILMVSVFLFVRLLSFSKQLGFKNMMMIFLDIAIIGALLWMFYPTRNYIQKVIGWETGLSGRNKIWAASWEYYLEGNLFLGHGLGVQIERIMALRLRNVVSTHNVYLYILNSGGILLALFYILVFVFLLRTHSHRKHYLTPLLIAVLCYGFFELACAPFDYWHLSNMFTICLFFLPVASGIQEKDHSLPVFLS